MNKLVFLGKNEKTKNRITMATVFCSVCVPVFAPPGFDHLTRVTLCPPPRQALFKRCAWRKRNDNHAIAVSYLPNAKLMVRVRVSTAKEQGVNSRERARFTEERAPKRYPPTVRRIGQHQDSFYCRFFRIKEPHQIHKIV